VVLVDYMQRHETQMQTLLAETLDVVSEEVLDTYFQFEPEELDTFSEMAQWRIADDTDVDHLIETVMRFDSLLCDFYAHAAEMAPNESVAALFSSLKQREEAKRNNEVRDALSLKDL